MASSLSSLHECFWPQHKFAIPQVRGYRAISTWKINFKNRKSRQKERQFKKVCGDFPRFYTVWEDRFAKLFGSLFILELFFRDNKMFEKCKSYCREISLSVCRPLLQISTCAIRCMFTAIRVLAIEINCSVGHDASILCWKKGKDPHPQDKIQHLGFSKDPRPLYYKTPPCAFYHKVRSKAVFGP